MFSRFILNWNDIISTFIYVVVSPELVNTPTAVTCSSSDLLPYINTHWTIPLKPYIITVDHIFDRLIFWNQWRIWHDSIRCMNLNDYSIHISGGWVDYAWFSKAWYTLDPFPQCLPWLTHNLSISGSTTICEFLFVVVLAFFLYPGVLYHHVSQRRWWTGPSKSPTLGFSEIGYPQIPWLITKLYLQFMWDVKSQFQV